jgi:hypothetical protein
LLLDIETIFHSRLGSFSATGDVRHVDRINHPNLHNVGMADRRWGFTRRKDSPPTFGCTGFARRWSAPTRTRKGEIHVGGVVGQYVAVSIDDVRGRKPSLNSRATEQPGSRIL